MSSTQSANAQLGTAHPEATAALITAAATVYEDRTIVGVGFPGPDEGDDQWAAKRIGIQAYMADYLGKHDLYTPEYKAKANHPQYASHLVCEGSNMPKPLSYQGPTFKRKKDNQVIANPSWHDVPLRKWSSWSWTGRSARSNAAPVAVRMPV